MDSTQPTLAALSIASWAGGKELTKLSLKFVSFFFSTKDVTIGPTAIMAIMTGEVFSGDKEVWDNYFFQTPAVHYIFFLVAALRNLLRPPARLFHRRHRLHLRQPPVHFLHRHLIMMFNMITVFMIIIINASSKTS